MSTGSPDGAQRSPAQRAGPGVRATATEKPHIPAPPSGPVGWERGFSIGMLHDMLRVRRMEEKCAELYGQQKIRGFLHLYIGQEAVAAGAMRALAPDDELVATYREHGHALLRGVGMRAIMAERYGKREGWASSAPGSRWRSGSRWRARCSAQRAWVPAFLAKVQWLKALFTNP